MFKPYRNEIHNLSFIYGHSGLKEEKNNRIYSIAASVIEIGKPIKEFDSLVYYSKLTNRDRYYSNITKEMIQAAPKLEEVVEQTRTFLKDQEFAFIINNHDNLEDLKKFCGNLRIIDLSFTAEFFLPHLESHSLKYLWEYLLDKKRGKISFSSSEVVNLSIELIKHICGVRLNDEHHSEAAAIRYFLEKSNTLFGKSLINITKNYKKYFGGLFTPYTTSNTGDWKKFLTKAPQISRNKKEKKPTKKISLKNIEDLFHRLSNSGKGYKFRTSQIEYAQHITNALNNNVTMCIEAGTGTGKTIGYLLPVLEFLYRNKDERVAISTYTKSLQEQIFKRELAICKENFKMYQDIPVALLKGKSSYLCAEKLDDSYDDNLSGEDLLLWLYFVNLIYNFRNADADSVGENIKHYFNRHHYLDKMLSDISSKLGCSPKHGLCPAQVITSEAYKAQLVITNHHKLALIEQDPLLNGIIRNLIIDEANHFESAVRNAFSIEVSSIRIVDSVRYLERSIEKILKKAVGEHKENIKKALECMDKLGRIIKDLRYSLIDIKPKIALGEIYGLPYNHSSVENKYINNNIHSLRNSLEQIIVNLEFIKDTDICRMFKIHSKTVGKIKSALSQLNQYKESLKAIESRIVDQNKIVAYQVFKKHWGLIAQPGEVCDLIREHIYDHKDRIIYTGASLCYKNSFEIFQNIVGLDTPLPASDKEKHPKEIRLKAIPSPFSPTAMETVVPKDAVNGRFDNKKEWMKKVVEILPELIIKNKGRTLVLFSSYGDLEKISEAVSSILSDSMFPLLIQQKGSPTINLCDEFRTVKESVLFGVDTFWHGVDFKGDTLTQVVITRIPYPSPLEPLQMARKKLLDPKIYWKRYYYDTNIKLKQGIGRLIRSDTDKGKVVILDSRKLSKEIK